MSTTHDLYLARPADASIVAEAHRVLATLVGSKPIPNSARRELLSMLRWIDTGESPTDSSGCTWTLGSCIDLGLSEPDAVPWKLTDLGHAVLELASRSDGVPADADRIAARLAGQSDT